MHLSTCVPHRVGHHRDNAFPHPYKWSLHFLFIPTGVGTTPSGLAPFFLSQPCYQILEPCGSMGVRQENINIYKLIAFTLPRMSTPCVGHALKGALETRWPVQWFFQFKCLRWFCRKRLSIDQNNVLSESNNRRFSFQKWLAALNFIISSY